MMHRIMIIGDTYAQAKEAEKKIALINALHSVGVIDKNERFVARMCHHSQRLDDLSENIDYRVVSILAHDKLRGSVQDQVIYVGDKSLNEFCKTNFGEYLLTTLTLSCVPEQFKLQKWDFRVD